MLNALTVDVEEYFHAENLRAAYPRERWDDLESRLDEPLGWLLDTLAARNVHATFFVLGWVAERQPGLVHAIQRGGHEVASHGYGHELVTRLDAPTFRGDVRRASRILEDLTGKRPRGYRAPCFTVVPATRWALSVLAEEGFAYDSSIFPIVHDRYGDPGAPQGLHELRLPSGGRLAEAPPATVRLLGRNWPVAGGGYLRLLPCALTACALRGMNARGRPAVVYLHPWELDPVQPRHEGVPLLKRVRHGIGTRGIRAKLVRLLDSFAFGTLETVLEEARLLSPAEPAAEMRPAAA